MAAPMRARLVVWVCVAGGLVAACDGEGGDGDVPEETMRLVASPFELEAADEMYQCTRTTLDRDMWVTGWHPTVPAGIHHIVLLRDPQPEAEDGTEPCDPFAADQQVLFATGALPPNALDMPDGVALRLDAGDHLVMNVHLINTTDTRIAEETVLDVTFTASQAGQEEAETLFVGPLNFTIPPGNDQKIEGACTMNGSTNEFADGPHMHALGKSMKVWADSNGERQLVYDEPFNDTIYELFDPVPMVEGDQIHVECTYDNTTGADVEFGSSAKDEMCFAAVYRYPVLPDSPLVGGVCLF
jgi:hypothetical protein